MAGCLAAAAGATAAVVITERDAFLGLVQPGYYEETFQGVARGLLPAEADDDFAVPFVGPGGWFTYTVEEEPFELTTQNQLWVTARETPEGDEIAGTRALGTLVDFTGIRITFTSGNVTAIGGDFFLTDEAGDPRGTGSITLTLSDGTSISVNSQTTASQRFVGFVAEGTETFTSLIVNPNELFTGHYVTVDNLLVGAAVPEPGAMGWMAGLALAGYGGWRRVRAGRAGNGRAVG